MASSTRRIAVTVASAIVFLPTSFAGHKFDWERVTPVPATEQIPTMDFFRPRLLSEPVLNPSGTHVAAIIAAGDDRHELLVYKIDDRTIETVGGPPGKDIYSVHWLSDSRLLFGLASRKLYGIGLMAADVKKLHDAYPLLQYYGSRIVSIPLKNRLNPLVWNRYDFESGKDLGVAKLNSGPGTGGVIDLLAAGQANLRSAAVDVRENNMRHILMDYPLPPTGITYRYDPDKEGELAYACTSDDGRLTLFRLEGKRWLKCPVDLESVSIVSAGNEPGQLWVVGPRQEGKPRALQLLDAVTGQLSEVAMQDKNYDFDGWFYRSPATGDVLGVYFNTNGPRVLWFNEEYAALQKVLDAMFPKLIVRIIGSDTTHQRFLVATFSSTQPVVYSMVDLKTRTSGLFKSSAPWVDPSRMREMSMIKFKTRDGRQLDAYVTLPAGATKENPPPLVVLPHGGPWVRDTWGFDPEVQFLASRGYAVMQPNYRGSTGTGWMFPEEDQWDFIKMHNDVTDAAKALMASGWVDKTRVAIMGGSFGGYLAISGVAREPGLYRCAVTNAGVFDWALQISAQKFDRYESPSYGRMIAKLGDPKIEEAKFTAMSPIHLVDKITVPVFVAGGKEDQTVEIQQSKKLLSALEKYNVPHEKLLIGGEAHGMAHLKNQVELYDRIIAFLDKNLLPKK